MTALYTTVREILSRPQLKPNERSVQSCHLHFNGPGAAGFGVKRAAMLLPQSAMLLVAPACCGRHGTITGAKTGFDDRIFYLQTDERDVVTGSYLKRIPQAAERIVTRTHPKALFLCMTCVDALLGTDLNRLSRQLESTLGIPVVACFMDPITRESKNAPMVSVQQAIMRCLNRSEQDPHQINLLGNFVPLESTCELYGALDSVGIHTVGQISACATFEEYQRLGRAQLNVVIHPQAVASARDLEQRLGIPYVELNHTYGLDRTAAEYAKLSAALGCELDLSKPYQDAQHRLHRFAAQHPHIRIAIGEAVNGNPLEIAETLIEAGIDVPFVLRNIITPRDTAILKRLLTIAPELPIYSGVHPSMHGAALPAADAAVGLDLGYFMPEAVSICWNMERQTFGFTGLTALLDEIDARLCQPLAHKDQMHGSYLVV